MFLYWPLDAMFCFSSLILMRASLKSSSLAKCIKESTLERQLFILYFQFNQGALFSAVATRLYLYFIAFVVPSKVLIEVSTSDMDMPNGYTLMRIPGAYGG